MKVLRTLVLVVVIAIIGSCNLLKEQNQGSLASTYSTLYAFFETATSDQVGCYPALSNNNTPTATTMRAVYSFQIERPATLVVCVANTTDFTGMDITTVNSPGYNMYHSLDNHTISFFVSNTKVDPGSADIVDNIRIPNLGALTANLVLGSGQVCPFNNTAGVTLVGRYDMDNLTDYQYIIAADDACGVCVGSGLSPFALARQYGVTY